MTRGERYLLLLILTTIVVFIVAQLAIVTQQFSIPSEYLVALALIPLAFFAIRHYIQRKEDEPGEQDRNH